MDDAVASEGNVLHGFSCCSLADTCRLHVDEMSVTVSEDVLGGQVVCAVRAG